MVLFLQVSVSLIFFVNKVLVLIGKKSGWLLGVLAAFLAIFYFYCIGLYVYTALEFGLIVLMGYGFFKSEERKPYVETAIRGVTAIVMFALTWFAFSGFITIIELFSSLGLLAGTYFLTHEKVRVGWLLYSMAHVLAAILGYYKEQQFFADFQIASAIVSLIGVHDTFTTRK